MYRCTFVWLMTASPHRSVLKILLIALLFMLIGTGLELYLLDHYEDAWQLIPLICIGAALAGMVWVMSKPSGLSLRIFKGILGLSALSGLVGVYLHMKANYEFELEIKPGAQGWDLFTESLSGALPALAPGSMIALALIGYTYTLLIKQQT